RGADAAADQPTFPGLSAGPLPGAERGDQAGRPVRISGRPHPCRLCAPRNGDVIFHRPRERDVSATSQPAPAVVIPPTMQEEVLIRADRAQVVASLSRGMAHDLRGPLQALTLLADPLADFPAGPGGAQLRQAVSESVQHLT